MYEYLPKEIQDGLEEARRKAARKSHRLRIEADGETYRVVNAWTDGFAVDSREALRLRGRVDLYDGARLLSKCLIIASEEDGDLVRFEYKRMTEATEEQPLDFVRAPDAPVALLDKS